MEQQQQALKYERRIQELEVQCAHGGAGVAMSLRSVSPASSAAATASILNYIPRSEHVRVLESRLAAKESDMTVEMNSRVNQVGPRLVVRLACSCPCITAFFAGCLLLPFGARQLFFVNFVLLNHGTRSSTVQVDGYLSGGTAAQIRRSFLQKLLGRGPVGSEGCCGRVGDGYIKGDARPPGEREA